MVETATSARDWGAVAADWDRYADDIDAYQAPATAALVASVGVRPGERVLELTAGPGSLGAMWSRLVGPSGSVVLSDVAPAMVDVARRRNAALANVSAEVLDASAIDRPDASFDVVASRMGLMFTPDPAVTFAEIRRVLAPGGRLGALVWAGMEHNPWLTCVGMAAALNGLGSGPPTGPGGIFSLGDADAVRAIVGRAGFVDVRTEDIAVAFRAADVDDHVARVAALAGPLARILAEASAEQRAAVSRTAAELAAPHVTPDGVVVPGRALLVRGTRGC